MNKRPFSQNRWSVALFQTLFYSLFLPSLLGSAFFGAIMTGTSAFSQTQQPQQTAAPKVLDKFKSPAWSELSMRPLGEDNVYRLDTKKSPKSLAVELFTQPRQFSPALKTELTDDYLLFDTTEVQKQMGDTGKANVQFSVKGLDAKTVTAKDYTLYVDIQGANGCSGHFYFEGRTADDKHYWKRQEVNFNGSRNTYAFDQNIPTDLRWLHIRLDFFGAGEFRLYNVRVEREIIEDVAEPESARLLFYAPFNGSADATEALGEKTPVKADKLEFAQGVDGQALHCGRSVGNRLEYALKGNLNPDKGSIAVWLKFDDKATFNGKPIVKNDWKTILSMPWEQQTRIGSGAIWFWVYNGLLRADVSDLRDSYLMGSPKSADEWQHVVFTWDAYNSSLYVNGVCNKTDSDSSSKAQIAHPRRFTRLDFDRFYVGQYNGASFEGWIDELKIYSSPLTAQDVQKMYNEYQKIQLCVEDTYQVASKTTTFKGEAINQSQTEQTICVQLKDKNGKILAKSEAVSVAAQSRVNWSFDVTDLPPGEYNLIASQTVARESKESNSLTNKESVTNKESQPNNESQSAELAARKTVWILNPGNPEVSTDSELKLKLLEKIDLVQLAGLAAPNEPVSERFVNVGDLSVGELGGRKYIQTGTDAGERFGIHISLPEEHKLYCLEWDFPDDAKRTVDIIAHSAKKANSEYELQTGYLIGDEYPNSGKMATQRCLYWNRSRDIALVFMSARPGGAAASEVRVYEVEAGLPELAVHPARPVNQWTRPIGIYFEDPAINYDFGYDSALMPEFQTMLNRLCAYMRYSGQNMLAYPLVWYSGMIGPSYMPRLHSPDFFDAYLTKFDAEGLEFMATINQNNMPTPKSRVTRTALDNGTLYNSEFTIHNCGTPHPGGWHGTPPNFNPLHPDVQKMTLEYFDQIIAVGAKHPSFKGIILHLPRHALHSFGDIAAGYNDYMIEGFEKKTGLKVDVDRTSPIRGKLYYEWLMANAREQWIDYRCQVLSDWYKVLAKRLSDARSDLKLGINSMIPPFYEGSHFDKDEISDIIGQLNREAGVDGKYLCGVNNIFVEQTLFPADYRWSETRKDEKIRQNMRNIESRRATYETILPADCAWVHQHDRYWESAIGQEAFKNGKPNKLNAPWLDEHAWRVSTLNPIDFRSMKPYIMPLIYKDVQGMSKGGFLIGTYAMEDWLRPFAQAFRALPAVVFDDVPSNGAPVSTEKSTAADWIKTRQHIDGGKTWFYIVNGNEKAVWIKLNVKNNSVVDLGRWTKVKADENQTVTLILEPYQLRSFAVQSDSGVEVLDIGEAKKDF